MKKWLTRTVLIVLVVVVVVVAVVLMRIDHLARRGVEQGATYALGVPTTLESADVKVIAGRFAMSGLEVSNPPDFDSPHFFTLDRGEVVVTLGSLMADTVELPRLALDGIDLNLEKKGKQANYEVIVENLRRLGSDQEADADEAEGKKFVIREVLLTHITVHAQLPAMGDKLREISLPDIRLTNIGTGTDRGVLLSHLSGIIIRAVLQALVQNAAELLPDAVLGSLDQSLAGLSGLGEVGMEAIDAVVQDVGKQVEQAGQELEQTLDEAGEALGEQLRRGLGGLLDQTDEKEEADQ
ncbi:MAG: hypothetical protein V3U29_01095 [Phycisphaeraceae bacterium]